MNAGVVLPRISVERIKCAVAAEFGISRLLMSSDLRSTEIVRPRQVAMYLAMRLTPSSSVTIGRVFGHYDHTTVLHAGRRIAQLREIDSDLAGKVERLERALAPPEPRPEHQLTMFLGPLFDRAHQRSEALAC